MGIARNREDLIHNIDLAHSRSCAAQRDVFTLIVELDRTGAWEEEYGARDLAHWLSMRYGISHWKACRWIHAAHVLERLPQLSEALASGELGVDKVVELCRFAAPDTEGSLITWAKGVSTGSIRHKADLVLRRAIEEVRDAEQTRSLNWWYFDEGRRFGLEAELPAADGAVVRRALERLSEQIPVMPGEEEEVHAEARRADALVMLASARVAEDQDPDRATVVVHTRAGGYGAEEGASELEGGPVIHPETAKRLMCSGRLQWLLEDEAGDVVRVGRTTREPPRWMMRALKHRDRECQFSGCGARRYLQAHHIRHWEQGGPTELDNLILICFFHHKLVHEYGWRIMRERDGTVTWFRPNGKRYRPGPGPPAAESWVEADSLLVPA
jgi:hypothetical protein